MKGFGLLGLSGCFRLPTWTVEWVQDQMVSSRIFLSVTGVHPWMHSFWLSLFFRTRNEDGSSWLVPSN